jgi:hypothetical protein
LASDAPSVTPAIASKANRLDRIFKANHGFWKNGSSYLAARATQEVPI